MNEACLQTGLPFIGFGFVDNFLMIVAVSIIGRTIILNRNLVNNLLFLYVGRYD